MLPSPLDYIDPVTFLNAWCEAQPEGLSDGRVRWLAAATGLSREQMWNVLRGVRNLTPAATPGLIRALELCGEAADQMASLVEAHHLDTPEGIAARRAVWQRYRSRHGLSREEFAAAFSASDPQEATLAVLRVALPALAAESPPPPLFARLARVVVEAVQVEEASALLAEAAVGERLAPGLVALPDPRKDRISAAVWSGALGWVRDSMIATPPERWGCRTWIWSADAAVIGELLAARMRLRTRLRRLAQTWAATPADHLYLLAAPQFALSEIWLAPQNLRRSETEPLSLHSKGAKAISPKVMAAITDSNPSRIIGRMSLPEVLRAWRTGRPAELASDGYLAKRMGRKRSYLNDLSRGRTRFHPTHVPEIVAALDVRDPTEVAWLNALARLGEPISPQERMEIFEVLRGIAATRGLFMPSVEQLFTLRWYVQAVFALAFLPTFRASPPWICRALRGRITWRAAEVALATLRRVGLLVEESDGRVVPTRVDGVTESTPGETVNTAWTDEVLRLFEADLDMLTDAHDYQGWMLALPKAAVPRLHRAYQTYLSDVRTAFDGGDARMKAGDPATRVLVAQATLVPVLDFPPRRPLRA